MVVQFAPVRLPKALRSPCQDVLDSLMDLRRRVFAEELNWRVWLSCRSDLDQYDHLDSHYVVACDPVTREVFAGARLLRTDRGGADPDRTQMTYMVRDAVRGLLPGLPQDLCDAPPPCDDKVWELTRFVSNGDPGMGQLVLQRLHRFLLEQGAERFVFLSPPPVARLAKSSGFTNVVPLGPLRGGKGGRYRVYSADLPPLPQLPK
ncbi:acyl-homoserine-lactone synthase [Cribrihabitans pelagius]|uniref:acyl-homoserine-lactone synthase n=1 Tax=Cribrihabitans pelagius TaxID=1765746 RepID=UPI003B5A60A2